MTIFENETVYYALVIIVLAVVVSLYLHWRLKSLEIRRRKRLKEFDEYDVTPSDFNQSVDSEKIESKLLAGISARFDVFRKLLYFSVWFLAVFLVLMPVLQQHSSLMSSFVVAAGSVVIGIAAKPFVENVICGTVLAFGKLARIGDTVTIDGEYGVIEKMTLTHCVIKRWDWLRYVIPNTTMMTKEFVNYSIHDDFRWVPVEFWIDYKADIEKVEKIARAAPLTSQYCSNAEDTRFWVVEMDKDSVKCMVVAWATQPSDGWMLSIDVRTELMRRFQEYGIPTHTITVGGGLSRS